MLNGIAFIVASLIVHDIINSFDLSKRFISKCEYIIIQLYSGEKDKNPPKLVRR